MMAHPDRGIGDDDQAEPDGRLPYGGGLDPEFDPLGLAEKFLSELLDALDVRPSDQGRIFRSYWHAMEHCYKRLLTEPPPDGVDRVDWLSEHFHTLVAFDMSELRRRYANDSGASF